MSSVLARVCGACAKGAAASSVKAMTNPERSTHQSSDDPSRRPVYSQAASGLAKAAILLVVFPTRQAVKCSGASSRRASYCMQHVSATVGRRAIAVLVARRSFFRRERSPRPTALSRPATSSASRTRAPQTVVSILPSVGDVAFEMKVKGTGRSVLALHVGRRLQGAARVQRDSVPRSVGEPTRRAGVLRERQALRVRHVAGERARRDPDSRVC